ncbi:hypothetical protein H257_00982 [Aphanomyces astaci]|uniref:Uncharacterized protein n=1 Tax=Aphanomyces astaci TaxID=112090 RepID=W4H7V6_APHAT|nr:hypothetical protein H257_00982 [Aphanomyces astaci]ETV87384.1 hypothetical protein H257_00982 [Aphanomyces astaci]|eukprot:XP_009822247.1 hypothetical protein H257_00982 [Aphanomyces astaci]
MNALRKLIQSSLQNLSIQILGDTIHALHLLHLMQLVRSGDVIKLVETTEGFLGAWMYGQFTRPPRWRCKPTE